MTENGYGKRTPLDDYRVQSRGGKGLITIKCSERNGPLVGIRDVHAGRGADGHHPQRHHDPHRRGRASASQGRNTQGVRIINLNEGDLVGGLAKISQDIAVDAEEPDGDDDEDTADGADEHQEEPSGE